VLGARMLQEWDFAKDWDIVIEPMIRSLSESDSIPTVRATAIANNSLSEQEVRNSRYGTCISRCTSFTMYFLRMM
jgi:hypothetical protein